MIEKVFNGQPDVLGDLPQQDGRNIAAAVKWNGSGTAVDMTKLLMCATLTHFYKAQLQEDRDDFARLKDRDARHSSDYHSLRAHKLSI
jgi:hypothetical protein